MLKESNDEAICLSTYAGFADNFFWKRKAPDEQGYPPPLKAFIIQNSTNQNFMNNIIELIKVGKELVDNLERATQA